MIEVRRARDRFHTSLEGQDSWHSFAFGPHYSEPHVQFGPLRALNDDSLAPGAGFGTHRQSEMEMVTLVLEGTLAHEGSGGGEELQRPGDVRRVSAGTGVRHCEYNASDTRPVRFLQAWLFPAQARLEPSCEQRAFPAADRRDAFVPVVSGRGHAGALALHQDAALFLGSLGAGVRVRHALAPGRRAYLFVVEGAVEAGGERLERRDGARLTGVAALEVEARAPAEVLLVDLP